MNKAMTTVMMIVALLAASTALATPFSNDFSTDPFAAASGNWTKGGLNASSFIWDSANNEVDNDNGTTGNHQIVSKTTLDDGETATVTVRLRAEGNYSSFGLALTTNDLSTERLYDQADYIGIALANKGDTTTSCQAEEWYRLSSGTPALTAKQTGLDMLVGDAFYFEVSRSGDTFNYSVASANNHFEKVTGSRTDASLAGKTLYLAPFISGGTTVSILDATVVPEPATMGLLGIGGLAVLLKRRNR